MSHPAEGEEEAWPPVAAGEAVAQPPVEEVLGDEGEDGQAHGGGQHVEDARHVVHVQLAGHHLVLLVVADPRQPLGLQLLHLACGRSQRKGSQRARNECVCVCVCGCVCAYAFMYV